MLTVIILLSICLLFVSLLLNVISTKYILLVRRNERLEDLCEDFRKKIRSLEETLDGKRNN